MTRRFYVENPILGQEVRIEGPDCRHIRTVNRLGLGDNLVLFDGSGWEFDSKITEIQKNVIIATVEHSHQISRELTHSLTLAVALPKGDRQKVLIEKLVELGVTKLIPLNCERSVVIAQEKSVRRLDRQVIEASKQCGRNRLLEITEPHSFSKCIQQLGSGGRPFIAHPYNAHKQGFAATDLLEGEENAVVAIGPEGGFSDLEIEQAIECGWTSIRLAPTILRVETAAVTAAILFGLCREPIE